MIELESVTKRYGEFTAVDHLSLKVNEESGITALLGPNGAGKSTTMRMMTGYLQPASGRVKINGHETSDPTKLRSIREQVGYLPETSPLYPEMLVSEYLDFMAKVRGMKNGSAAAAVSRMVEALELGSHLYSPVGILSRGFRQRVAIAGTLIHNPGVIILDEPTSGLDPNQISHIRKIIRELGEGRTLILSTHILQEAEDMCSRVVIMSRGRIVADENLSVLRGSMTCRVTARGEGIADALAKMDIVDSVKEQPASSQPDGFISYDCKLHEDIPQKLFENVAGSGWEVREFRPVSRSLQDIFEELTI